MGVFSHSGNLVICFFRPGGPTIAVRNSRASSAVNGSSGRPTNSENEGTALSLSLKYVGRLRGVSAGGAVSVARLREEVVDVETRLRETCRIEGAFRHLNRVAVLAIVYMAIASQVLVDKGW